MFALDRPRDGPVVFQQRAAVFRHARNQWASRGLVGNRLRRRQAFGVLLQALDAEKLGANRLFDGGKSLTATCVVVMDWFKLAALKRP